MNDDLRRCPNCGAYVMGNDNRCPRCDFDLTSSAPDSDTPAADPARTELFDMDALNDEAAVPVEAPDDADTLDDATPDSAEAESGAEDDHDADEAEDAHAANEAAGMDAGEPDAGEDDHAPEGPASPTPPGRSRPPARNVAAIFDTPRNASVPDAPAPPADLPPEMDSVHDTIEHERPAPDIHTTRPGSSGLDAPVVVDEPDLTEMPTTALDESSARDMHATQPRAAADRAILPPAPYTPPPVRAPQMVAPPALSYIPPDRGYAQPAPVMLSGPDAAVAYLQQRVAAYRRGGYRVQTHGQYEASLTYGKRLGVGTWILALLTLIGALWYLLIMALSGFRADVVYVVLEDDGRVYEDGPGAAHIRGKRARLGRRWSAFGLVLFLLSLILAVMLGVVGGIVLSQDRYQAALREAYPAVTLFEDHFSPERANPDDVDLAKNGAVAFAIVGVIAAVGLWGGATLFVIGTVHASAYRVHVPPLPGWA